MPWKRVRIAAATVSLAAALMAFTHPSTATAMPLRQFRFEGVVERLQVIPSAEDVTFSVGDTITGSYTVLSDNVSDASFDISIGGGATFATGSFFRDDFVTGARYHLNFAPLSGQSRNFLTSSLNAIVHNGGDLGEIVFDLEDTSGPGFDFRPPNAIEGGLEMTILLGNDAGLPRASVSIGVAVVEVVPEPSSGLLLLVALGGIRAARRFGHSWPNRRSPGGVR